MTVATPASAASPPADFGFPFRVSARTDYAIRALTEMAASGGGPITAQHISRGQAIPLSYLLNILTDLRRAGLVRSHRGRPGSGYVPWPSCGLGTARDSPAPPLRGNTLLKSSYRNSAGSSWAPSRRVSS